MPFYIIETRSTHKASNRHSPQSQEQDSHGSDVLDGRARVITQTGQDVSSAFIDGAQQALDSAIRHGCRQALLKANSPSCGNRQIYSGHFDQQLQPGSGVTASLLQRQGISVFNENEMDRLLLTKPQP